MAKTGRDVVSYALFLALAANLAVFAWRGELTEALESAAWLALLLMFDLECGRPEWLHAARRHALDALRAVAIVAVVIAETAYVLDEDWLDAANAALWIAVVVLLESEARWPLWTARHRAVFKTIAGTLYLGLGVLVCAWLWRGDFFDAWDATLWLAAFVLLERKALAKMATVAAARRERLQ